MQKKNKISLITSIILILIIISGLIAYAAVTINGKNFTSYGGNYYTAYNAYGGDTYGFGKSRSDEYFLGVKYSDIKDYYFGFDGLEGSDYTTYIAGSPDGYCLNEKSGTGNDGLYVADIIDIEGNKITFNKSGKTAYGKQETLRLASAIYLKYNYKNSKDMLNRNDNEINIRHWITTGGGWKAFYDKYNAEYIKDSNVASTYGNSDAATYNKYVDAAIQKYLGYDYVNTTLNNIELKDNNTTKPMATTGEYTISGSKYKTKMGPYSLQLNSSLATSVSSQSEAGTYQNGTIKKEADGYYYIYFKDEITSKVTEITVQQSYSGLKARLIVLGTGSNQARLIARAYKTPITETLTLTTMPVFEVNVSLQKYITKLNDKELTQEETQLLDRKNTYATTSDATVVSKSEESSMKTEQYKYNNIVLVEEGDKVTYRIHVYNNSDYTAKSIVIRDKALYYDNTKTQYSNYAIEKITRDGQDTDIKSEWAKVSGTTTDEYEYTITNLPANSETYFDITVVINKYEKGEILDNTAYIANVVPTNKTEYRIIDSDYIEMVQYSTEAKKYIDTVQNGDSRVEVSRDSLTAEMTKANPLLIEVGDTVTYVIKVTNTSDVETTVFVKDTISGFEYSNLQISDWSYENGTGELSKLSITSENVLNSEGKMAAGSTATCTVSMKVEKIGDANMGTNTIEAWTKKQEGDPEIPVIPEYFGEKKYLASLHKIVSSVNETDTTSNTGVTQTRWDSWESDENKENKAEKVYDKHNNPVTVANGDKVTYTIKVKNDGTKLEEIKGEVDTLTAKQETCKNKLLSLIERIKAGEIKKESAEYQNALKEYENVSKQLNTLLEKCTTFTITEIEEKLPSGVEFVSCSEGNYENGVITGLNITLAPQEEKTITVIVTVTEPNISLKILKNEAKIKTIKNESGYVVEDLTPDNNNDADYIQLKDITIEGMVWNDKVLNKLQDNYNGEFNEKDENSNPLEIKLPNIKVYLYRENDLVAETVTDDNGNYKFDASMLKIEDSCSKYIKAPYQCQEDGYTNGKHQANYWKQQYYSYYIQFEYDGITYTSTTLKHEGNCLGIYNDDYNDSNAKEALNERKEFNEQFKVINNTEPRIEYTTKNENGYIPQSNHIYNKELMKIKASTEEINLSNVSEEQLKHINLGLRGRDIFDLELTSDVYEIKVTVNGQIGVYKYNNKVKLRTLDIEPDEDMANKNNEVNNAVVESYTQSIREQELKPSEKAVTHKTVQENKYSNSQGLQGIDVTYKITLANASRTKGTATKIINYYDSRYDVVGAYVGGESLSTEAGISGSGFKSVIITTKGTLLNQSEKMEIYLVLRLKNPRTTLQGLLSNPEPIPTYNMSEIYEYKTAVGKNQTEHTRGLIDKDSAPGSANKEVVNLTEGTKNVTTVEYYFGGNNLSVLKYEDDTYATPTLYFGIPTQNNTRKLEGIVFRDTANVTAEKIKTGNGIKDNGEVGIYGATVELVELNEVKDPEKVDKTEGIVRYRTTTDENGKYSFENFLPGNYIVRYYFGDSKKTVVAHQYNDTINNYSFNGEDYQSTNNIGEYGAKKLNTTAQIWYAYNEKDKVSTGTENLNRRQQVSTNVIAFNDTTMDALNDLRDKKDIAEDMLNTIVDKTLMYATTPNFTLTVEETQTDAENANVAQKTQFSEYNVENMNFGIAEVPITTIDLQKQVKSFIITDAANENVIAKVERDESSSTGWKIKGNVLPGEKDGRTILDTSIEEDKLQGAKLQVTYEVSTKIDIQKDFRTGEGVKPTITALADFIDNDLSYNKDLNNNDTYWEVKTADDVKSALEFYHSTNGLSGNAPKGTVDPEHTIHTSQVFAKAGNPILNETGGTCEITLEKTLSSEEITIGDIITSNINTYEYDNTVEILGLQYDNTKDTTGFKYRDRVRRTDKYIILPGTKHDSAISEAITIHPPTGDTGISLTYYVITAIGLSVLAVGVFGIKKFVINAKK